MAVPIISKKYVVKISVYTREAMMNIKPIIVTEW